MLPVEKGNWESDFSAVLGDLPSQGRVSQMADHVQHGRVTTLNHTIDVARTAFTWARALNLHVSEEELVRGAVLHDYYLYDWHQPGHTAHATCHPLYAEENALQDFELTPKERNIIAAHMWPLPPTRLPHSLEAWLVCFADKWCSLKETVFMR